MELEESQKEVRAAFLSMFLRFFFFGGGVVGVEEKRRWRSEILSGGLVEFVNGMHLYQGTWKK